MGMVLSLIQFTPQKLQDYLRNPEHFEKDLTNLEENNDDQSCYLDKAWEAIHYILTGTRIGGVLLTGTKRLNSKEPLSKAIYSEQFFDQEQNLGVGPASYLTADQVSEINTIISKMDSSFVKQHYHPSDMNEMGIYPTFWNDDPSLFDYVNDSFNKLKTFYADAASKGNAVASYLS
jgi:hypothetical protein